MGITANLDHIDDYIQKEIEKFEKALVANLNYIGLTSVRYVRNRTGEASWFDHTGNLRSSIGYVIVKDGKVIQSSPFEKVQGPEKDTEGVDGSTEGRLFAESLAPTIKTGYALILVAGMEYASKVEALDNKDVLASAEIEARKLAKELLSKIGL